MSRSAVLASGVLVAVLTALAVVVAPAAGADSDKVIVRPGERVEIAFTAITEEDPILADLTASFRRAIDLAVASNPTIDGFPVRIVDVETSCGGDNTAAAGGIVAHRRYVGVLGFICSEGAASGLPVLESAGIVSISGSSSRDALPASAPTTFNRVVARDGDDFESWYAAVMASSVNGAWRAVYQALYGSPPLFLADLYFDAAALLLAKLDETAKIERNRLVVDRSRLAAAARGTLAFAGASCAITIDPATGNRVVPAAGPC